MNIATNFYNEIFNHINNIVEAAIETEGPCYSPPKNLEKQMVELLRDLNCFKDYMVTYLDEDKHIPKIISREEYYKITHPNGEFDF